VKLGVNFSSKLRTIDKWKRGEWNRIQERGFAIFSKILYLCRLSACAG
jgi:hypothetical protein